MTGTLRPRHGPVWQGRGASTFYCTSIGVGLRLQSVVIMVPGEARGLLSPLGYLFVCEDSEFTGHPALRLCVCAGPLTSSPTEHTPTGLVKCLVPPTVPPDLSAFPASALASRMIGLLVY